MLPEYMNKCDFCGEDLKPGCRRCPYCGSLLGDLDAEVMQAYAQPGDKQFTQGGHKQYTQGEDKYFAEGNRAVYGGYPSFSGRQLGNGLKVLITVLCTMIPGIGQLAGIILSIVFMNSEDDHDRHSFGLALLISSIVVFFISCILWTVIALAFFRSS